MWDMHNRTTEEQARRNRDAVVTTDDYRVG
jgi:hypothetical protein